MVGNGMLRLRPECQDLREREERPSTHPVPDIDMKKCNHCGNASSHDSVYRINFETVTLVKVICLLKYMSCSCGVMCLGVLNAEIREKREEPSFLPPRLD